MTSSAHAILENEVRELVRRRGIDPISEPLVVGRLVDEVVGEYRDRSVISTLPPMGDVAAATRAVLDAVAGFGPLQPLLDDVTVEEIWINDPPTHGSVLAARPTKVSPGSAPERPLWADRTGSSRMVDTSYARRRSDSNVRLRTPR